MVEKINMLKMKMILPVVVTILVSLQITEGKPRLVFLFELLWIQHQSSTKLWEWKPIIIIISKFYSAVTGPNWLVNMDSALT